MALNFNKEGDNRWVANVITASDFVVQVVFAQGQSSQLHLYRSLDGEHFHLEKSSALSDCPILQYDNYMDDEYYQLVVAKEPIDNTIIRYNLPDTGMDNMTIGKDFIVR